MSLSAWLLLLSMALPPPDSLRSLLSARLDSARAGLYATPAERTDASLSGIARAARAGGLADLEADALIALGTVRNFGRGPVAALAALDSAARVLPAGATRLAARLHCLRAYFLLRTGSRGVAPGIRAGHALAQRAGAQAERALCYLVEGAWRINVDQDASTALGLLDSAEAIERRIDHGVGRASALWWMGYDRFNLDRFGEAKAYFEASVRQGLAARNVRAAAWAHRYLYAIAVQHGDLGTAERHLAAADTLFRAVGDQEGLAQVAAVREAEATIAGDWRALERSSMGLREAADRLGLASLGQRARSSHLRAALYDGRYDVARERADTLRRFLLSHELRGFAADLEYGEGLIALGGGDLSRAEAHFRAYLAASDTGSGLRLFMGRARLAEVAARRGDLDLAMRELDAAMSRLEALRGSLGDLRARAFQAQTGWADPDVGFARTLDALVRGGRVEEAFAFAERRRARALDERIGRDPAWAGGRETAGTLVASLPRNAALLEYVAGRPGQPTLVFVVTSSGIHARSLLPIDSVTADIRRFAALLEAGDDASLLAARLGRALLADALRDLPERVDRLVIVPDDVLHRLPFDALVLPGGTTVLERYATSVVPSAAVLVRLWRRERSAEAVRLLALGDPQFEGERDDRSPSLARSAFDESGGLPRLAGSAREVAVAASYAERADVRVRGAASEAAFKRAQLPAYGLVHFATHALVDDRSAGRTALALAPGEGEDGFLEPAEIEALSLRADLVVLSACRTAGGVVLRGEGVEGLTAPLLGAGARSIVATHWRIVDRATLRVVDGLYAALADGEPVDRALRRAKLRARNAGLPPRDWAAFVLVGDGATRVPLSRPGVLARMRAWWAMR